MSQDKQRRHPRQPRRVQVRIRVEGEERTRHGFTKNISQSGALITGADLPGRGTLLRLELIGSQEAQRVVYARVVHAHRVPAQLRRFAESGMGVRFLRRRELIAPFLGEAGAATPSASPEIQGSSGDALGTSEAAAGESLSSKPWPISGGPRKDSSRGSGGTPPGAKPELAEPLDPPDSEVLQDPPGAAGTRAAPDRGYGAGGIAGGSVATPKPAVAAEQIFDLRYETPEAFLSAYRRDLVNGGLFITTRESVSAYDTVTVRLHLPPPVRREFRFDARVVQVVDGQGAGLEVLDADRVLDELRPVVDLLK